MSSKLILIAALATIACVNGRNTIYTNQELSRTEKETRTLIEVPAIGIFLMVTYKIVQLVINVIGPLFRLKLAAVSLIKKITTWMYQHYFPIIIGTVVLIGYCVVTGMFTQEPEYEVDHRFIQAAKNLDIGALKYARIIN